MSDFYGLTDVSNIYIKPWGGNRMKQQILMVYRFIGNYCYNQSQSNAVISTWYHFSLQWRHNGRNSVSNHQPHDCLLKGLFRHRSQRKHESSASLAFVHGIHRGPVNSPHKWPVTRKMFPFDDVPMDNEVITDIPFLKRSSLIKYNTQYHNDPCDAFVTWQWRHNEHHDVSNYWRLDCMFNNLSRLTLRKQPNLRAGPLWGESTGDWFPFTKGR